jgi:hypothetical protein
MKFLSDVLAKAGLIVDGVVTLNNTATGQTPDANDNSTKLATTAWVRTFVQPYSLPIASASVLGGIKVGTGLSINSTTGVLSVSGAGAASIKSTQTFVVTEGQTVFTVTGGYTPGLIDIFVNGVYLSPNQTTATNGTTFTINDPAATGDIVDVIVVSAIYEGATTTTDQLPEGVVNLYYTNARARAAITLTTTGVSGAATYNSSTGVFNIPNYQGLVPAGGNTGDILAKTSATNYDVSWIPNFTSTVQHTVKAGVAVTKGQAVYVSSADGTNMIVSKASNASEQTSSKTLGLVAQDLAINGQGFVVTEGLLAGLNTSTANAGDPVWLGTDGNLIFGLLNKPYAPAHLVFIGVVTRVQQNNGEIFVKVQNGFELDELHDLSVKNASDGDMIKYVASTGLWTKIAATTTNITEGTNLYYTQARFDTAFAAKSTTNLTEGTNLYYTTARANSDFDTRLATKSTTNLTEGTNLYYTTARANSDFDTRLATKSTTNLAEGTNLYYTDARVGTYLTANSYATQSYVSTQINNLVSGAPGLLDTLDELAAALGDDANFATTVSTALSNRLRVDINNQGLTSTQQGNGRTNLGLGSLAVLSSVGNAQITDVAWSKVTGTPTSISGYGITDSLVYTTSTYSNPSWITALAWSKITGAPAFITGYTETDTLASVTGRGATTTSEVSFNAVATTNGTGDWTNASTYTYKINPSSSYWRIAHLSAHSTVSGVYTYQTGKSVYWGEDTDTGDYSFRGRTLKSGSNTVWHAGNLTNLNQLTNGPGYITSYTETDTLASVTGRGASTASQVSFTKTDDHAISVGTIRGRAVGNQSGEFIQLYERVNIGGPNGWGASNTAAPSYGLSVFGGGNIGYGNNGGLSISGITYSVRNTASGLSNLGFQTSTGTIGNIHIQNGAGPGNDNGNQAAITFQGGTASEAQAGIYVLNNNSYGTSMGFATTNSYAAGPQLFMTATNGGVVNFPRATPTVQGNGIWHAGNFTPGNYLPLSGGVMTGALVNNTDGAVLMESNASENNNWLFKENSKAWGLFWFNRGSQSGQTVGGYTTVGAEVMFMGGGSGIAMPSNWTGYYSGSYIAAMISNYNGYIYSASTIFAAGDMRSPIFYDSNDTGYYGNFASTSRVNGIYADYIGIGQDINTSYRLITNGSIYLNSNGNGWAEGTWKQRRGGGTYYDVIDSGNIGSQSVSYASTSGTASYSGYADRIQTGNNQWNWSTGAHTATNPNTITLWDQYSNYGGAGYLTAYATIMDIYGRSGHEHDQLYFDSSGTIYHRNCFYGTNTWNGWRTMIDSSNIGSQSVSYASSAGNASTVGSRSVGNSTDNIAYFDSSRNLYVNNPESYSGEVRLGAAWGRGGVYTSNTLSLSTGSSEIHYVFSNSVPAKMNSGGGIYWGPAVSYSSFIRPQAHPDQGYTGSSLYWVEIGSYGGTHVVLNMDGSAGSGENGFDHFTIWQTASNSSSGSRQFYVTNIGNVWARNDITAFSDIRVKENIRPIENALEKVVNSRGVIYDRIDTGEKNGIGFIAQELEIQLPDLVKTDDKGLKSVKYQNMVAVLTEAIKEQQTQIESQKSEIEELKDLVKQLINR